MNKDKLRGLLDEAFYQGKNDSYEGIYKKWRDKKLNSLFIKDVKCKLCGKKLTEHSAFYDDHEYSPINEKTDEGKNGNK